MQRLRQIFLNDAKLDRHTPVRFSLCLLAGLLIFPVFAPTIGQAQNVDLQTLNQRIERLQRDLNILQKDYYRGEKRGAAQQSGASTGANSAGQLANAEIRMSTLEADMRRLTGQLEEVRHGIQTVLQRLDGLVKDVDFRLTEIERRQTGAPAAANNATTGMGTSTGTNPPGGQTGAATSGPQPPVAPSAPPTVLPKGTPIEQYNYAYSLLLKVQLAEAETAFQEFLEAHGDDALAGNAQYWLGETYYARNKLSDAARAFLVGLEHFPTSSKTPDTMLKLGITLGKMGQKEEACVTYIEMKKKFPNLRAPVGRRLRKEMKAGSCN
ncbi:MAG: tol-pal system protein YbgF [Rhodospirillaceae bacterium]|nr:tol-pal system protein YbgF [Rhodospirillaceae bacterium]MBT4689484.1 tol-pal system protein YbgF [Rhodospirillaceae bacterium]MBT5079777.1 tol-pal system protein YbgF [Rhodospirillaceae bacterium]MBT5523774.1 tol-pal system protein YbgF [Rhodospirillaceae bacterium]MBT5881628.1 tol-pal system protein YbgF [Rhodospirillaceae bacterium]